MRPYLAGLALASALAVTSVPGALADLALDKTSPARGHAQVIAHGVVRFEGDRYAWLVTEERAGRDAATDRAAGPGFYLGEEGVALITDLATDAAQALAGGEAATIRDGGEYERIALDGEATIYQIELVEPGEVPEIRLFTGNADDDLSGMREISLVRDNLKAKERASIPAGAGSTLIIATSGEIEVTLEDGDEVTRLAEGEATAIAGDLVIRAGEDTRASYVAAVIGEEIVLKGKEKVAAPPVTGGGSGAGSGQTVPVIAVDSDGDGLDDALEVQIGTDPTNPDTDQDGLIDGDEYLTYGSDPLSMDGDGLPDYNEVMQHGTNPAVADTDADGINDHDELGYGTNPLDPDSDDDGVLDGTEIFGGSDPLDPASKP